MKGSLLSALLLLSSFLLSSCAKPPPYQNPVDLSRIDGYFPPRVVISGPQTYISPNIHEWDVRTGIFIFTSDVDAKTQAYAFTRTFHKKLLQKTVFKTVKMVDLTVGSDELAISKGREFGFDYVLFGNINEYSGTVQADVKPKVSVTFRIVDVRTKETLWYIEDSASGDAPEYKKWLKLHSSDDYPPVVYLADRLLENIVGFLADFKARKSR